MRVLRFGMQGTDVMEIQSLLNMLGYAAGPPDGIFGNLTQRAVMAFQRNFGLVADGVIGFNTYRILNRYLLGYDYYTVRPGDTLYIIAKKYHADPILLQTANPSIQPGNLATGSRIVVPYGISVVDTDISYTYDVLQKDIAGLAVRYPFLETGIAGISSLGRNLYYIRLGRGPNEVFYNGAHHALEWITVPVLMKFIEDFSSTYAHDGMLAGYRISDIFEESSIYIIPMVNPDGVDLVLNGLQPDNPNYFNLIRWNNNSTDFSTVWQANNRGVDLNHNYNAAWEASREESIRLKITGPGPTRFPGPYPESEPESMAVADFTRSHNFRLVLAYHSQGEVIYWNFMNLAPPQARLIGEELSRISGYALEEASGIASYAGYKDWFTLAYRRPGYTIEVGRGKNPLPISQFDTIYNDNLAMLLRASVL